ncbi:MAG: TetR/AcrR family transcriptional regulator [Deltaproteobacteria bacterium]|nr:TetR/AcrR family transcriptional regulator [Deltaproteobacteria bacterium]
MNPFDEKPPASSPKGRLIQAAIAEIEARGMAKVTVRGVAAAADANIAAVNYHFGSKERLLDAAREATIQHMLQDTEVYLASFAEDPLGALTNVLAYYLEGAWRYPQMTRAHLYEPFKSDDYTGPFPRLFEAVIQRLQDGLCGAVPDLDPATAARRIVAALSGIFFPACFGGLFTPLNALDSPEKRALYAREVVEHALTPLE